MNQIEQKAIDGLIEFWSDMYTVCGKEDKASQLKLYLKPLLKKSDPLVQELIGNSSEAIKFYTEYADTPVEIRREKLEQLQTSFARFTIEHSLYILVLAIFYLVIWCISEGLSFEEIETLLQQQLDQELSNMIVGEIITKLKVEGIPGELKFRLPPSGLGLSLGSIVGANARLRSVLEKRLKQLSGNRSVYQQDLSIALLECIQGKNLNEFVEALGDNIAKQVKTLKQIMRGKQPKLVRSTILRIVRKAIEDLPDIADTLKERRHQEEYLAYLNRQRGEEDEPLSGIFIRDESLLENIEAKEDILTEKLTHNQIIELLSHEGINKDDLTENQWWLIFQLNDAFYQGAEIASKKGLSLHAYFGDDSATIRKQLSRLHKRITELKTNRPRK